MRVLRTACVAFAAAAVLAAGPGCAETMRHESSSARPMPPRPRAAPAVPVGTKATQISLQVAPKPRDTNGNGYPDLIELYAYLFSDDHSTPFYEDGAFIFDLYLAGQADDPGARPLHTWRIDGERLRSSRGGRNIFGPFHFIQLSMLEDGGSDRYPTLAADLTCRFEPADGRAAVVRRDVHRLQIGAGAGSERR